MEKKERGATMSKTEALKVELEKKGIFTDADLSDAIKRTSIDVSLMVAGQQAERMAG